MNRTQVEWVKSPDGSQGYSWNPITGCLDRCTYCYARRLANGRLRAKYLANKLLAPYSEPDQKEHSTNPFYPRFWPGRLKELPVAKSRTRRGEKTGDIHVRERTSKGIFVCNMCEFFADWVPASWQKEIITIIRANPQHRFYFLTKQPWNVAKFSPFPDNCWIGVTVCDKRMAFNADRYYFKLIIAKLKYLSFEPLLEDVMDMPHLFGGGLIPQADWVIIGSQTKPYNPPKIEWIQAIVEAADEAGVPVFQKDNLRPLLGDKLRQEFPEYNHLSSNTAIT